MPQELAIQYQNRPPRRSRWRPILAMLLVIAPFASSGSPAVATVFVRSSDAEMADHSPVIVEGRILSVQAGVGPALEYRLLVERTIKGQVPDTVRLRVPGGPANGAWWAVTGAPRFSSGSEVLLFLVPRSDGTYGLSQLLLGAFRVISSVDGPLAVRDLSAAHELLLPDRPTVTDGPRQLARFRSWLRDRSLGIERASDYFTPLASAGEDDPADHPMATAKTTTGGFQTIVSTNDPPPLGCGPNGGHSVRWLDFDVGGEVAWRAYFSGQPGLDSLGIDQLEAALEAWSSESSPALDLVFEGLTSAGNGLAAIDGTNTVLFEDPNDEIGGTWIGSGILALGGPWYRCDRVGHLGVDYHPVVEGDIITQDGLSRFFVNNPAASSAAEELFAHELGHTLGFAHSLDPEALMYSELHDDGRGATLSADDRAALDFLYGAGSLEPPQSPLGLIAVATAPRRVELAWSDESSSESGFRIERRLSSDGSTDDDEGFELVGTAARNSEGWSDTSVEPATAYGYRIRAQNGAGGSPFSPEARVTTPPQQIPSAPTDLRAAALSSHRLRLTWQDNAVAELGYRIEVLTAGQVDFVEVPVSLDADTRSVILSGLEPGRSYSLRVRAFNSVGSSLPSNVATVWTFAADVPCEVTADTLCLLAGRFSLRLDYRNQHDGGSQGFGHPLPDSDNTGFVWFFDPSRLEVVVKMVDGRGLNGHYWIYLGGLSDLEYSLLVTDTATGETRRLDNPAGALCGQADIELFVDGAAALATPWAGGELTAVVPHTAGGLQKITLEPPSDSWAGFEPTNEPATNVNVSPSVGNCQPSPTTLCLLDRRLAIEVSWSNPYAEGVTGEGQVIRGSDGSGTFWFFDPRNLELIVKAIDGSTANGFLWLFYGALSDVEYQIDITDTLTGNHQTYYNPPGNLCGGADIEAFPSPTGPNSP